MLLSFTGRAGQLGVLLVALACAALLAVASSAKAATYHYCNPCGLDQNVTYIETTTRTILSNYVHYIGDGNRSVGAGRAGAAQGGSAWAYSTNTAIADYGILGVRDRSAASQNPFATQYSTVTANAHTNTP